jgi:hypothetical protein
MRGRRHVSPVPSIALMSSEATSGLHFSAIAFDFFKSFRAECKLKFVHGNALGPFHNPSLGAKPMASWTMSIVHAIAKLQIWSIS